MGQDQQSRESIRVRFGTWRRGAGRRWRRYSMVVTKLVGSQDAGTMGAAIGAGPDHHDGGGVLIVHMGPLQDSPGRVAGSR